MAFKREDGTRKMSLTSLIDVVFLLLCFFLAATKIVPTTVEEEKPGEPDPFLENLPSAEFMSRLGIESFHLKIQIAFPDKEVTDQLAGFQNRGRPVYKIGNIPDFPDSLIDVGSLEGVLAEIKKVARGSKAPKIFVKADRFTPYRTIARIMEKCREEELKYISFALRGR